MVLALVGGLWWFNEASGDTQPPTIVATSCSGFAAGAQKLVDTGDATVLSGTFAPGDTVQFALDFNGVGYSWELTGVLAKAKRADVTGGSSSKVTKSFSYSRSITTRTSTVTRGEISGSARLDVEVDVATAGEGAITIRKTSSEPALRAPRVASASCEPWKEPHPLERG
jgi:hypothetical protein